MQAAAISIFTFDRPRSTACLNTFSSKGCSNIAGTAAFNACSSMRQAMVTRSAKRSASICTWLEQLQFPAQGDEFLTRGVQACAQEIAEAGKQAVGARHVHVHERRDCVQGIEEKMRTQLGREL